ncbi:hypothetical protein TorRG33x02_057930 [Trema orientale]|uniref:NAD(P)-binding domain containing protein n=1 Tax=Trema orientale TaxID=63057 RepID=A0A2P5FLA6_TREOI|nr:hypothetical protein TorRG33x02_057930 [Trema orientale]
MKVVRNRPVTSRDNQSAFGHRIGLRRHLPFPRPLRAIRRSSAGELNLEALRQHYDVFRLDKRRKGHGNPAVGGQVLLSNVPRTRTVAVDQRERAAAAVVDGGLDVVLHAAAERLAGGVKDRGLSCG